MAIEHRMAQQPVACIGGIALEPAGGAPQPKGVTPRVHVVTYPRATDARQDLSPQDLQVANRIFFWIIATCILRQYRATLTGHAGKVRFPYHLGIPRSLEFLSHVLEAPLEVPTIDEDQDAL